ncbi:MAG: hypothetical protein H6567_08525 [Lewinellaceae bacterium]|nr:hypothetical protein [Lewinellaceae bacterium]
MPTLQIRDIPQDLYDRLVISAEENRRSLTQQAIVLLEVAVNEEAKARLKKESLNRLRQFKPFFNGVKTEDIVQTIRDDRDR